MTEPFKKYALEIAQDRKRRELDPIMRLKKSIVGDNKIPDLGPEIDPYKFVDPQAFEAAGGRMTASALDHFNRVRAARDQATFDERTEERRIREESALVSDAGMEGLIGKAVNASVGFAKTSARIGSDIASAPDTIAANALLDNIPEDVFELSAIAETGERELTEEENKKLDGKDSRGLGTRFLSELAQNSATPTDAFLDALDNSVKNLSYRERIKRANTALGHAENIDNTVQKYGVEPLFNPVQQDKLKADIGATYDQHAEHFEQASRDFDNGDYGSTAVNTMIGLGNLLKDGSGDLLSNPAATFEFIVEQAPYLGIGAYSKTVLGAVNATYATDIYREKLTAYQEEHGRPPSQEDRASLAMWAGTAAIAEQAGNLTMLSALKGRAGFSKAVTKILEKTPDVVTKTANNVLTKNLLNLGKTAAVEGMTEVYQTAVEESEKNPFDGTVEGKALFTAGLLGAAAGGGFASIGATGDILSSITGESVKAANRAANDRPALRMNKTLVKQYTDEIADGKRSMESILDPTDVRTYDPAQAASLYLQKALDPEAKPEDRAKSRKQAEEIMEGLSKRAVEQRAELEAETNKVERKKISKSLRETQEFLRRSSDAVNTFNAIEAKIAYGEEQKAADIKTATENKNPEEAKAASDRAIHSMILNSNLYSEETILTDLKKLKESPSISQEQKEYISSIEATFTAQNAMANIKKKGKEVTDNILNGDVGFKGILEYRRDVNRALKAGDINKATAEIDTLRNFARDHKFKLDAAKAAREQAIKTRKSAFIHRDPNAEKGWRSRNLTSEGLPWNSRREQSQLGGFEFKLQKNGEISGEQFVASLESEVAMINSMGIELSKAIKAVQAEGAPAQASAATAATPVEQAPESVENNETVDLEAGFDTSVVPQPSEPTVTGTGDLDAGQRAGTAPETAQGASQEVENTQNQTNRTQNEISGDNSTASRDGTISDDDINAMPPLENDDQFIDPRDAEEASQTVSEPASRPKPRFKPRPKLEEEPEVETVPVEGPVYSPGSDNANQSVLEMRRDSDSFTYTQDQAEALQGLMKAIGQAVKGTVSWLLLEGKAGTGKTTLVENLVNASNAAGKPVLVLAPTNKAIQVLKGKLRGVQGITKESTIHKMIYGAPSKNKKTGKIKFSRFKEDAFESGTEYTIFLDEASMVNLDQMQDLERALDIAGAKARIVLLGDGNQLEPIGKDPKIFSEDSAIQIDGKWSLQEVRRQSLDSNILKIATATADQQTPIVPVDGDYGDTRVLPLNEAAELAVEEVSQDPKNSVILVSTNNVRNRSNAEVRERIYGDDAETTPLFEGEPLIGQANTEALVNSETLNAPPIKKLLGTVTLSTAKGDQLAYVYELENGKRLLLATALPGPSLQGDALLSDKSALAQSLLLTNEQGKKTGKFDPEIMVATYAYALTIHKSQGSQWRNVFVLADWLHRDWAAHRVIYTAVTRASDTLTIGFSPNVFTQERVSMAELEGTVNDYIGRTAKPGVRADGSNVESDTAPVAKPTETQADTTTEAQAAPAAQEPDVVVSAQTETEQNQDQEEQTEPLIDNTEAEAVFTQRQAGRSTITVNPLATKENFFSKLSESGQEFVNVMQRYLEKDITEKQSILLNHFAGFVKQVDTTLQNITGPKRNERFEHEDLLKTFGEFLPENIRAGVIASIFSVIGEDGWKTRNFDSDINAILNRDSNTIPTTDERRLLGQDPIVRHNVFARKLGKRVMQFLNIQGQYDQPADKIRNLEAALGAYAIGLMAEENLLVKWEETNPLLNENSSRENITHNLVRINVDNPRVQEIVEKTRSTGSVLTKLFGTEEMSSEPASKPGSFVAAKENSDLAQLEQTQSTGLETTTDNTPVLKKNIPAVLAKILEIVSRRPQKLNNEVGDKLLQFHKEEIGRLAGTRSTEDGMIHKANEESVQAANDGIIHDIESWLDFKNSNGDTSFYLRPVVWLQQRVGLAHSVMNPQSSKVHRHLMYPKSWETEIDPASNSEEAKLFKVAAAQGMGFAVDKKNLDSAIAHFDELMEDPVIQAGMEAILKDNLEEADKAAITAAVKQGGEKLWSFHVLLEMAKYSQGKPFTTNVMIEIDGVTNGPALTNLMLGVMGPLLGSKVGLIQQGVSQVYGINNHNQFKEQGGRDMYESLAHLVQKELNKAMQNLDAYQPIQDILYFTGSFSDTTGRKRVKTPLTQLKFGSGLDGTIDSMASEFIELYYEAVEKSSDTNDFIAQQEILTRINRLLSSNNQVQGIDQVLTTQQQNQIRNHFSRHVGKAVETALETQFENFIERRTEIYGASKALFEVYQKTRDFLISEAVDRAIKDGTIKVRKIDGKEQAIDDLSQRAYDEIDRKLGKMLPTIHTALSKLSNGQDRTKGLMLAKQVKQEAEGSNVYRQKVEFARPLNNNFTKNKNGTRSKSKWVRVRAEKPSWEDPGVRAVVLGIHATDSAIASRTYGEFNGLNVHDAIGFRLKDAFAGGRALNRNTFRVMTEYSLPLELLNSLQESHDALQVMLDGLPVDQRAQLQAAIDTINLGTEKKPIHYNQGLIDGFAGIAYRMEVDKLQFMSTLDKISQYSLDGTEYQVTDADRKIVNDRLTDAQGKLSQYGGHIAHQEVETERQDTPNQTKWGLAGTPRYNSDPDLVRLFGNGGKLSARKLASALKARIKSGGRTPEMIQFETRLLNAVMKAVDPDMEIRLIRPDSPAIEGMEDLQTSIGFYHPDGWIGIKSPEFTDSMLTTEMLLHELLHAATTETLRKVENGEETSPAAVRAQKRLQTLLTRAQAYIQKEGLTEFENATQNVNELISWGLTNADFQEQVLSKIQLDPETQQELRDAVNKETGFMAFIKSLAGLLFKNRVNQAFETGLGSLVANSAMLIQHAAQNKPDTSQSNQIHSMSFKPSAFSMTPQEVFAALAKQGRKVLSPERSDYLLGILTNITDAVFQDGAFKERVQRETPFTAEDVFAQNIKDGEPAFNSDVANTLELSEQERYVLESLELAMRNTLSIPSPTARSINRETKLMWEAMKKAGKENLFDGDWNTLSADQKHYYETLYNSIFNTQLNSENRAIFLSKFLAAATVYPPLSNAMNRMYLKKGNMNMQGMTMLERVKRLMELGWAVLMRWVSKARTGDSYHAAALKMIKEMVRLEKQRQLKLEKVAKKGETGLEAKVNKLAEGVRQGIGKATQADIFQNSKNSAVKFSSTLVRLSMEGRVGMFMDNLKKLRDGASGSKTGFLGQSWTELRGDDDILAKLTQLLSDTKTLEQTRKRFNIEVSKDIKAAFEGKLTPEESEALTKVLVRSGAHILMDHHSMAEVLDLVANQATRRARIKALEAQLPANDRGYYSLQAKALGIHIATGEVDSLLLMRNAYNIANKLGTSQKFTVPADVAANAETIIDELATLHAIDNQGAPSNGQKSYRALATDVMVRELARVTEDQNLNGVEFLLRSQKEMEQEAHNSLFGGDKTQIVKGYTKDTYDPYIDVVIARKSDWKTLEKAGYTRQQHELLKDDADPREEEFAVFTARNGGLGESVTAIFNNVDGQRQGTSVLGDLRDNRGNTIKKNENILHEISRLKNPGFKSLMNGQSDKQGNNSLVPVLDTNGSVISWRYMMTETTRDKVLRRNNDVGDVMGNIASSIVDKTQTPLVNKNAVDALRNIYEENFVDNSDAFIEFGPNSTDPEIQERWKLLPHETKKYIRQVWGRDGMMIRNDTYNILFGYRKFSIGDVLKVDPEHRNVLQHILAGILGEYVITNERGEARRIAGNMGLGKRILQAEAVWQEIVTQVKDILVIKSLFTLMGNESSNLTVLLMHGVPITQIPKMKTIAYASTKEYIAQRREKESLERTVRLGHLQGQHLADAQERVIILNELMAANPVAELMDDGMYQTLVEDVSQEDDPYSYQSGLTNKLEAGTRWVPKPVKTVAKTLVMTHDTGLYKLFNDMTVMSDFTSRYVLNEHLKNRMTDQLSPEDRRSRVRDAFVDYDVPTSKQMQYLNDMGLVWFSKYYMRIQHVILQMVRENPFRALQIWGFADYLFSLPDILDSNWLSKDLGNSLGNGAFEIMDAPREIYTLHVAGKL